MKKTTLILASVAALAASALDFDETKDIRYSDASPNCILDVKWPKGVTNFATMVFFHGGGLVGDGKGYGPWPEEARERDAVARVGCRYRVFKKDPAKNATRPEDCLDDAAAAVAWTLRNIAGYGGDPKKVFVSGVSAGGYQTAMIGMDPRWLAKYGYRTTDLCGIAPYTGQVTKHFNVRSIGFRDAEPRYAPKVDEWAPLYWCKEKAYPPICLVTGGRRDNEMPCRVEENEFLAISLKRCGIPNVEFHETEGSHGGGVKPSSYFVRDFMAKTCDCGLTGRFADGESVVFAGDSTACDGGFVADLQLFQSLRHPGSGAKLLVAETDGAAAQTPERFGSDILKLRPDRVFVLFGADDAFAANQLKLTDRLAAAHVKTVVVTPSPLGRPAAREPADGVRASATERLLGCVDFFASLARIQQAQLDAVSGPDVPPQSLARLLLASVVLEEICEPPTVAQVSVDAETGKVWPRANKEKMPETRNAVVSAVRKLPTGIAFTYAPKALPLPKTPTYLAAEKVRPVTERFNQEVFFVKGLPEGTYELAFDDAPVGTFSAAELEKGVNVALLDTPNQKRAQAAAELAEKLRGVLPNRRADAEAENLRERLDAVRPAVSRVTVMRK